MYNESMEIDVYNSINREGVCDNPLHTYSNGQVVCGIEGQRRKSMTTQFPGKGKVWSNQCHFNTEYGYLRFGWGWISNWGDVRYPVWINLPVYDSEGTVSYEKYYGTHYVSNGTTILHKFKGK